MYATGPAIAPSASYPLFSKKRGLFSGPLGRGRVREWRRYAAVARIGINQDDQPDSLEGFRSDA